MRLPNGYGNVSKLPGKRRNPWRARKTSMWEIDTESKKSKQRYITIGYYPTRSEALAALSDYNKNPNEIALTITFEEVYNQWSKTKFKEIGKSNTNGYNASYAICKDIYNIRMIDITLSHLQKIVDESGKNYPTLKKLKVLMNQIFDYSVQHQIISKDRHIVEYLNIGKPQKSTKHYRFTDEEIKTIWSWSENNEYIQVILMLIYSGVRPGELFNLKKSNVNLEEKWFFIEKGKNDNAVRKVPIHSKTLPFFKYWFNKNNSEYLITKLNGENIDFSRNHSQYTESYWKPLLKDMGILTYKNGNDETKNHTPDDTRHTFTTMWKEKRLDEAMRRKIQGHSGKGIGEMVYTHFELKKLCEEIDKL